METDLGQGCKWSGSKYAESNARIHEIDHSWKSQSAKRIAL